MQLDQGFTGSHWTPPSGNYLLRIAVPATRATINKPAMKITPGLLAISIAIVMCRYYTARIAKWMRFRALQKFTKRRHRASTRSQSDMPTPDFGGIFHQQIVEKELELT
jgi:hypothetical protein